MTQLIVRTGDDGKHYAIVEIYFACYRALSKREVKPPTCTSCRSMREWRYCSNNSNNVIRRWWVASLPPRPHYPRGKKTPASNLIEGWVNPKTGLDAILFRSLTVSLASLAQPYFMYSTSKWWDVISVVRGHAERLVLPVYFNQTRICFAHVSKNPEYISRKSVREKSSCSIRREKTVGAFQRCFVHDT